MRGRRIVAALVAVLSSGHAGAEQSRVAVDWSRVTDTDVERCGLSRLRAGTIERLVDGGYAVVGTGQAGAIGVVVSSVPRGLRIRVSGTGNARDETLQLGKTCDATTVLDVIARIFELVVEVDRERVSAARPPPAPAPAPEPVPVTDWQGSIDFTARANDSPDALLGGGLSARLRVPEGWEAGVRGELAGNAHLGVTILEPFIGLTGAWQPDRRGAGPYVEVGPVLHLASSDVLSVVEPDVQFGAGLQVSVSHILAHVLVTARVRRFQHRVGADVAYDTGHLGMVLRIGAQLFDP
jgi:hypothetical protein